jgi:hypothetical protein
MLRYRAVMQRIHARADRGDYAGALSTLASERRWSATVTPRRASIAAADRLLAQLHETSLLLYAGRYVQAARRAEGAAREAKQVRGATQRRLPITRSTREGAYRGTAQEASLLLTFAALARLSAGQLDAAQINARRLQEQLQRLRGTRRGRKLGPGVVLPYWLVGRIHEAARQLDDARIAYRYALQAARHVPPGFAAPVDARWVRADLARVGVASKAAGPTEKTGVQKVSAGELLVVIFNGRGPRRETTYLACARSDWRAARQLSGARWVGLGAEGYAATPIPEHPGDYVIRARGRTDRWSCEQRARGGFSKSASQVIAQVPTLVSGKVGTPKVTLHAAGRAAASVLAHPVGALSKRDFATEGQTVARARAILRASIYKASERSYLKLPDLRSWSTLPERIELARLRLPAGRHRASISFGPGRRLSLGELQVRPGGLVARAVHLGAGVAAGQKTGQVRR